MEGLIEYIKKAEPVDNDYKGPVWVISKDPNSIYQIDASKVKMQEEEIFIHKEDITKVLHYRAENITDVTQDFKDYCDRDELKIRKARVITPYATLDEYDDSPAQEHYLDPSDDDLIKILTESESEDLTELTLEQAI